MKFLIKSCMEILFEEGRCQRQFLQRQTCGFPVSGSGNKDRLGETSAKILDLERKIDKAVDEFVDKKEEEKAKEIITEMFKESIKQEILERGEELITTNQTKFYDERKALIDIHVKINELGLENFNSNKTLQGQAISFYKSIVSKLLYGGQKLANENIMDVVAEDVGNNFVLVYECNYLPYVMCQNAQVILVETENKGIRVFTLETSFMGYVLCEYTGTAHNNYGSVDANSFRPLLLDIINND